MKHYDYQSTLKKLWKHAIACFNAGEPDLINYFTDEERQFLNHIGIQPNEIYDYAEDFVNDGEPDFTTCALIQHIRRKYFLEVQKAVHSSKKILPDELPARSAEIQGIVWLPRIIAKAKAKLRGELDPDIMFCCGGDRKFCKTHNIHPAEFLQWVFESDGDDSKVVERVVERIKKL